MFSVAEVVAERQKDFGLAFENTSTSLVFEWLDESKKVSNFDVAKMVC
jgi:hypothetical protein